jgi:hypothetical protein
LIEKEELNVEDIVPGLIVRHTSRKIGNLSVDEARQKLISGEISFSEFVDQAGEDYREILEFMTEFDLHPGRPQEVLHCIDCYAVERNKPVLQDQLARLYGVESRQAS